MMRGRVLRNLEASHVCDVLFTKFPLNTALGKNGKVFFSSSLRCHVHASILVTYGSYLLEISIF